MHLSRAALGNLADQGSDQARAVALDDLIDKWFYGADMPVTTGGTYCVVAGSLLATTRLRPRRAKLRRYAPRQCGRLLLRRRHGFTRGRHAREHPEHVIDNGVENGVHAWTVRSTATRRRGT